MSWVAVGVGAATLVGGYIAGQGAQNAAQTQADAAAYAADLQYKQYKQQRKDAEPWRNAGVDALGRIQGQMGDFNRDFSMQEFQEDPGYQFRMAEGQKALERSAAARGGLNSGRTMKELARYSQGVASDEYQNAYNRYNADRDRRFNRLASLAGIGQTANQQVSQAGQNFANQAGSAAMQGANAQAAGMVGQANAWNNAISSGVNNGMNTWISYQMMNQNRPPGTSDPR